MVLTLHWQNHLNLNFCEVSSFLGVGTFDLIVVLYSGLKRLICLVFQGFLPKAACACPRNPKFYEANLKGGYEGVREISKRPLA